MRAKTRKGHIHPVIATAAWLAISTTLAYPARAQCPTQIEVEPLAEVGSETTATEVETGWTGVGHRLEISEGHSLVLATTCGSSTPPCGVCSIDGIVSPQGRCSNDRTVACTLINAADPACGGARCDFFLLGPAPQAVGGVAACFENRLGADIAGTVNPATGSMALDVDARMDIYLGPSIDHPCATCDGDPTPNDGLRQGLCSGGARNGGVCDVTATDLTFGDLSMDCPLSAGVLINPPDGLRRALALGTGTSSLGYGLPCDSPLQAFDCPCDVCSVDTTIPCASDADCPSGTCSAAVGQARQPNSCDGLTCDDSGDGVNGTCASPVELFCDGWLRANGDPILGCLSDADCDALIGVCPGPDCGNCTLILPRQCFLDPIVASGVASVSDPVVAGTLCLAPTISSAANNVLGLPGPERVHLEMNVVGLGCPAGDNCPSVVNLDQLNSDCPDASFFNCGGCSGTVPAPLAGCCDGGDACDPCPAYADNTRCNSSGSGSGVVTPGGGGTVNTGEMSGTVSASITVPVGAVSSSMTISVTKNGPATGATEFIVREGGAAADVLSISVRPENLAFNSPVTVTLRWDDRDKDGLVDRGVCQSGASLGLPCDHDGDCGAGNTCSLNTNVPESSLVLRRNNLRFSKGGFGVTPFACSDHLTGGGCQTAVANCADVAGTGQATVANCCDPTAGSTNTRTYGEWTFQTCDFSEFMVALDASGLVPGKGSTKTDCVFEWAPNNPTNEDYLDNKGLPNFKQECRDGDPVCDRDNVADGKCSFEIGLCINIDDPRLLKKAIVDCTPTDVASWEIIKPRVDAADATDQANALTLLGAALSLGTGFDLDGTVTYTPAVSSPAVCSDLVQVVVPVGKRTLKVRTETSAPPGANRGAKDTDTLKLTCRPAF